MTSPLRYMMHLSRRRGGHRHLSLGEESASAALVVTWRLTWGLPVPAPPPPPAGGRPLPSQRVHVRCTDAPGDTDARSGSTVPPGARATPP